MTQKRLVTSWSDTGLKWETEALVENTARSGDVGATSRLPGDHACRRAAPRDGRPGGGREDATAEGSWAVPLPQAPAPSTLARVGPSRRGHAATASSRSRCPDLLQDASSLQRATPQLHQAEHGNLDQLRASPLEGMGWQWEDTPLPQAPGHCVGRDTPQSGGVFKLSGKVQKTTLGLLHLDLATGH